MLNLMCLAYRDYGAQDLAGPETAQDRSEHLFETYIDLMFRKRGLAERGYLREHTVAWLSRVAARLLRHNQTMFLIEDLQPSWLSNRFHRWAYLGGVSLVVGLFLGLVNTIYWSTSVIGKAESNAAAVVWFTVIPLWFLILGCVDNLGFGSGSAALDRTGVPPRRRKEPRERGLLAPPRCNPLAVRRSSLAAASALGRRADGHLGWRKGR